MNWELTAVCAIVQPATNIDLFYDMTPSRLYAITCINDDPILWWIYVSIALYMWTGFLLFYEENFKSWKVYYIGNEDFKTLS